MSYKDVEAKLYHGHRKVANNTYLTDDRNGMRPEQESISMRLHGNLIARFYPDYLELYSAGRHTQTTKDRLNLALGIALIPGRIFQRDWQWYYDRIGFLSHVPFQEGMKCGYA